MAARMVGLGRLSPRSWDLLFSAPNRKIHSVVGRTFQARSGQAGLMLQHRPIRAATPLSALQGLRFNSTPAAAAAAAVPVDKVVENVVAAPASDLLNPVTADMAVALNDITKLGDLHSLGLGSYFTPVGWLQNAMEAVHLQLGLPWWATIVGLTFAARFVMLPLMVTQMRNSAKLHNIRPQSELLTAKLNTAKEIGDKAGSAKYTQELSQLFKKNDCSPWRGLVFPLIQTPLFISFFIGIRKMALFPIVSMQSGGILWFPDLTAADPYLALPILSAISFLITFELGSDGISTEKSSSLKNFFRFTAVTMVPLTYTMPSAVFLYWVSSSLFSISQFAFLKIPGAKKFLKIPEMVKHKENPNIKTEGFWESIKKRYKAQTEQAAEQNKLRKLEEERAARMAAGPPTISMNKRKKPAPPKKP